MQKKFILNSDTPVTFRLESSIVSAEWLQKEAREGGSVELEIKAEYVGEGAVIKVTVFTSKGRTLAKINGNVSINHYRTMFTVPEKIKSGESLYFEAVLPKHGLSEKSDSIPVKPAVHVKDMRWDKREIHRGETVSIICEFDSGVTNDDQAEVKIFEYNRDNIHDNIVTLPAKISNNKIDIKWICEYRDDTEKIPSDEDLRKYGKQYYPPEFFFTVVLDGETIGKNQKSGLLKFRDEIKLMLTNGRIASDNQQEYVIALSDGSEIKRKPGSDGCILLDNVDPGKIRLSSADQSSSQKKDEVHWKTGTASEIIYPDYTPLFDSHMHIQSNNCCPLPMQWGLLALNARLTIGRPIIDRKKLINMTDSLLSSTFVMHRMGKIGRLSSDLIARLYMNELNDNDMKVELSWTVLSQKKIENYEDSNQTELMRIIAGKKACLSDLTSVSLSEYNEDFLKETAPYFHGTRLVRMNLAMSMDMSYGSYWGRFGIPVYLKSDDAMLYINDFISCEIARDLHNHFCSVSINDCTITPCTIKNDNVNKLAPDCPSVRPDTITGRVHLYPSFFADEAYIDNGNKFYLRQFDMFNNTFHRKPSSDDFPVVKFQNTAESRSLASKNHVHFVDVAPGEDDSRFEDYSMQREFTVASVIRYPLTIFAFYHYDPRRHRIGGAVTARTLAENLLKDHSFFTYSFNKHIYTHLENGVVYKGTIEASPHHQLNDIDYMESVIRANQRTNEDAFGDSFLCDDNGAGLFWGMKMYPRLGYAPDDFKNYPNLTEYYRTCESKGIPITIHCGPGGMSVHDYFLYERYDDCIVKDEYGLKDAEEYFDGTITGACAKDSPARWAKVLERFPKLKICLAHFGGCDMWKEAGFMEKAEKELEKRKTSGDHSKYDDYDKYRDWIKSIAELVSTKENVYTDLAYFVNDRPAFHTTDNYLRHVAGNMSWLVKKYPDLKDRILVGSDWYMIEIERNEKGVGEYFSRMFKILKQVSRELQFDAWHQFAAVNPLRYMGLIEEKKGSRGPFKIDVGKLERYAGRFKKKLDNDRWVKKYIGTECLSKIKKDANEKLEIIRKSSTIIDGNEMKKENQLIILSR